MSSKATVLEVQNSRVGSRSTMKQREIPCPADNKARYENSDGRVKIISGRGGFEFICNKCKSDDVIICDDTIFGCVDVYIFCNSCENKITLDGG